MTQTDHSRSTTIDDVEITLELLTGEECIVIGDLLVEILGPPIGALSAAVVASGAQLKDNPLETLLRVGELSGDSLAFIFKSFREHGGLNLQKRILQSTRMKWPDQGESIKVTDGMSYFRGKNLLFKRIVFFTIVENFGEELFSAPFVQPIKAMLEGIVKSAQNLPKSNLSEPG